MALIDIPKSDEEYEMRMRWEKEKLKYKLQAVSYALFKLAIIIGVIIVLWLVL